MHMYVRSSVIINDINNYKWCCRSVHKNQVLSLLKVTCSINYRKKHASVLVSWSLHLIVLRFAPFISDWKSNTTIMALLTSTQSVQELMRLHSCQFSVKARENHRIVIKQANMEGSRWHIFVFSLKKFTNFFGLVRWCITMQPVAFFLGIWA